MRIALITESFAPDVNGVANSVGRVADHLYRAGHQPLVIAPAPASTRRRVAGPRPYPVVRVPSVPTPGYRGFRIGVPGPALTDALIAHAPDVVHLASPFVLGARGGGLAASLGLPTVAVYQTDMAAYLRLYGPGRWRRAPAEMLAGRRAPAEILAWRWLRRIHNTADLTLAPSKAAAAALSAQGIERVRLWPRGVDLDRFSPARRSERLRRLLAPGGELLVGYVGRLAPEKRVELLGAVCRLPGVRVVVVGDGPSRPALARALPGAVFLGERHGHQLARIYASLDVFAHTGPHETFGQTVQEALASGVPVVAPAAGGPMDLVTPGLTGALVPPADAGAIAAVVAGLRADPGRRDAYARAARESVAGRSWSAIGDLLLDHYYEAIGIDLPGKPSQKRTTLAYAQGR
ncbi:glycosyltransferase [Natronosporangium hydrolyticum]|uniref:Glycosyltransferase n=1 Tax=Natronosporangium hydrolyticum TaxID=2811111 RepID=A0A895YJ44_9ACTN|nr:glycosyltransferase [Natronosporangium hydrolyticum]QSB13798.1 glycosyltransferase [Natronosporangium hydrolyticum]